MYKLFKNREDAAVQLAVLLSQYKNQNALVLAMPTGGVPIGHIIAKELNIPLDISLCKNMRYPDHEEYALGSVHIEEAIINNSLENEFVKNEIKRIKESLKRLYKIFRGNHIPINLKNKIVIIADDGIDKGDNTLAIVKMAKRQGASDVIVVAPVISPSATNVLKKDADKVIALTIPHYFMAVGQFYEDFRKVENEEVIRLLNKSQNLSPN